MSKGIGFSAGRDLQLKKKEGSALFFFRFALTFVFCFPVVTLAAGPPTIKSVPAVVTSPVSGPIMFKEYCASCHGADARGHGPAAPALKVPPPDLTLLSRGNHGKFPDQRIYTSIKGDPNMPSHGSKDMPVWGSIFHEMATGGDAEVASRMRNLCLYIQSLQQK